MGTMLKVNVDENPIGQAIEHDPIKLMNIIDDSFLRSDVT